MGKNENTPGAESLLHSGLRASVSWEWALVGLLSDDLRCGLTTLQPVECNASRLTNVNEDIEPLMHAVVTKEEDYVAYYRITSTIHRTRLAI